MDKKTPTGIVSFPSSDSDSDSDSDEDDQMPDTDQNIGFGNSVSRIPFVESLMNLTGYPIILESCHDEKVTVEIPSDYPPLLLRYEKARRIATLPCKPSTADEKRSSVNVYSSPFPDGFDGKLPLINRLACKGIIVNGGPGNFLSFATKLKSLQTYVSIKPHEKRVPVYGVFPIGDTGRSVLVQYEARY